MKIIFKIFRKIYNTIFYFIKDSYFGFTSSHAYIDSFQLSDLRKCVEVIDNNLLRDFEHKFAAIVGNGECVSYAAGRMGFYEVMRVIGIRSGDEVILTGATCSVMANAVIRTGATPIYSDIDPETFGSSPSAIESCISTNTRLIVAQHSFGIPCKIEAIKSLATKYKLFLLEDCALSLGSKINGITLGNFGDAALFSTDHSKPINTIIGGLIYSNNKNLIHSLREKQADHSELSIKKKQALWKRFLLERIFSNPRRAGKLEFVDLFSQIKQKLFSLPEPFLADDYSSIIKKNDPYPAKIPSFLAKLGIIELDRWPVTVAERKAQLKHLLLILEKKKICIPKVYQNSSLEIIPLRIAWVSQNSDHIKRQLHPFLKVSWTWFTMPIVATSEPLSNFNYTTGQCPISEDIGPKMVNLPCNLNSTDAQAFEEILSRSLI